MATDRPKPPEGDSWLDYYLTDRSFSPTSPAARTHARAELEELRNELELFKATAKQEESVASLHNHLTDRTAGAKTMGADGRWMCCECNARPVRVEPCEDGAERVWWVCEDCEQRIKRGETAVIAKTRKAGAA